MLFKEGDTFGSGYEVNEEIYHGFIHIFKDENPLHTDDLYARENKFEAKVMHGAILVGFLSHFIGEVLPVKNVVVLSYGIAFNKPVYLGDKLWLSGMVSDVSESTNCVDIKYEFKNINDSLVSKGKISIKII